MSWVYGLCFFFQAEDGIRDLVRSRGLGDVYKRQVSAVSVPPLVAIVLVAVTPAPEVRMTLPPTPPALSLIHI